MLVLPWIELNLLAASVRSRSALACSRSAFALSQAFPASCPASMICSCEAVLPRDCCAFSTACARDSSPTLPADSSAFCFSSSSFWLTDSCALAYCSASFWAADFPPFALLPVVIPVVFISIGFVLAAVFEAFVTASRSPTSMAALLLRPASALFWASHPSRPSHDHVRARRVNISAVLFRSEICESAEMAFPASLSSAAVKESITATMPELAPVAWFTESIIDRKEFVSAVFACESVRGSFSNSAFTAPVCF